MAGWPALTPVSRSGGGPTGPEAGGGGGDVVARGNEKGEGEDTWF